MSDYIDFDAQQTPFVSGEPMDWDDFFALDQWCQDHPVTLDSAETGGQSTPFVSGDLMEMQTSPAIDQQLSQSEGLNAVAQPAPFDFEESFDFNQWCRDQGLPLKCSVAHDATAQDSCIGKQCVTEVGQPSANAMAAPSCAPISSSTGKAQRLPATHDTPAQKHVVSKSRDGQSYGSLHTCWTTQGIEHQRTTPTRSVDEGLDDVAPPQTQAAHLARDVHPLHTHAPGADLTLQCPVAGCKERINPKTQRHFYEFHAAKRGHILSLGCRADGCSKIFSRFYELERHFKQCHETIVKYECTAKGCYRGTTQPRFARADKLTSHIRACHDIDTLFTCLETNCSSDRSFLLEELGLHCRRNHTADIDNFEWYNAIINATSWTRCRCPIWSCRQYVLLAKFQAHLSKHHVDEVRNVEPFLREAGYLANPSFDLELNNEKSTSLTFSIQCPVCNACCDSHEHFKHHLWGAHLFHTTNTGPEHFLSWRDKLVAASDPYFRKQVAASPPWKNARPWIMSKISSLSCAHCSFETPRLHGRHSLAEAHPSFMRPVEQIREELMPFRMQILRLYPDFKSHPVFDDYNMPEQRATAAEDNDASEST